MVEISACPVCGNRMIAARKVLGGLWEGWCFSCDLTGPTRDTSGEALEALVAVAEELNLQIVEAGERG